jgi:hypothetical protein
MSGESCGAQPDCFNPRIIGGIAFAFISSRRGNLGQSMLRRCTRESIA